MPGWTLCLFLPFPPGQQQTPAWRVLSLLWGGGCSSLPLWPISYLCLPSFGVTVASTVAAF